MSALIDLKDLTLDCRDLAGRIRALCGDDDQAFADTLEGETDVLEGASRVIRWMNEQGAQEAAMKELAATYTARAKVFSGRVEGARTALFHFMQYMGLQTLQRPEATLSIRAGTVKVVGEPDPAKLPDNLVRIKREPDMAAIKLALQGGQQIEGVSLSNGEPVISIRVR